MADIKIAMRSRWMEWGLSQPFKAGYGAILMYHGVDQVQNTDFNRRFVSESNLRRQLRYLKKHCHILSVSDFFAGRFQTDRFNVAVTFDDGFLNNYKYAFPLLEEWEIPATFYVTGLNDFGEEILWADLLDIAEKTSDLKQLQLDETLFERSAGQSFVARSNGKKLSNYMRESSVPGYTVKRQLRDQLGGTLDMLRKTPRLDDYWRLMSNDQIREVAQSKFVQIASHGYYHNNLGSLSTEDAVIEVKQSCAYLENLCGVPVNGIAYPDGSYTPDLAKALLPLGINEQLAVHYRFGESKSAVNNVPLHRSGIEADGGFKYFWFLARDSQEWIKLR